MLILDPLLLSHIAHLHLRAKNSIEGSSGTHAAAYKGFSTDFLHHRPYAPGDEPRRIDWNVYAKSDRYVIKQFTEDTTLNACIVLDTSMSMGTHVWEYSTQLAAAAAYLLTTQHDAPGLATFAEHLSTFIPPRRGIAQLHTILDALAACTPAGTSDIAASLLELAPRLKRRMLVVLISDLLADPDKSIGMIKQLAAHKHDVIVLHVFDHEELKLDLDHLTACRDSETGETAEVTDARKDYSQVVQDFFAVYETHCKQSSVDYCRFLTNNPIHTAFAQFLTQREQRR